MIAYRELTPTYLPNGLEESIGQEILEKAENFFWFITFEYFGMIKLWEYKKHHCIMLSEFCPSDE